MLNAPLCEKDMSSPVHMASGTRLPNANHLERFATALNCYVGTSQNWKLASRLRTQGQSPTKRQQARTT